MNRNVFYKPSLNLTSPGHEEHLEKTSKKYGGNVAEGGSKETSKETGPHFPLCTYIVCCWRRDDWGYIYIPHWGGGAVIIIAIISCTGTGPKIHP